MDEFVYVPNSKTIEESLIAIRENLDIIKHQVHALDQRLDNMEATFTKEIHQVEIINQAHLGTIIARLLNLGIRTKELNRFVPDNIFAQRSISNLD